MNRRPVVAVLLLSACLSAAAFSPRQDESRVEVKEIRFEGNQAFTSAELRPIIATRQSGVLPWSSRYYFDHAEFEADLARIRAFYADHGFPDMRIDEFDVTMSPDRKSVRIRIAIREGTPVIVGAVRFEGFEILSEALQRPLRDAPLVADGIRDRDKVRETRDLATRVLQDNGYPLAHVDASERPAGPGYVIVTFRADSGRRMQFGETMIEGLEKLDADVLQRHFAFDPGDLYRESKVLLTQRRLTSLPALSFATVDPRPEDAGANRVPVRVTVAEAPPRLLRFAVGYGTEERARGSVEWQHSNLFGGGRLLQFGANASYLGLSTEMKLIEQRLRHLDLTTEVSVAARRTHELTYDWQSYGAHAAFIFRTEADARARQRVRYDIRGQYAHDFLRYGIHPDSLDDLSLRQERIALGLDPTTGRAAGTLGSISLDVRRTAVDDEVQPRRGTIASLHLEHAAPWLHGTYRFDEIMGEMRAFASIGATVLANRLQVGSIVASDSTRAPFSKRYFLGGATTLRGWGRFEVGPVDEQGLPIGGRTLVLLSSEVRFPLRGRFGAVGFVDAGNVGTSDWNVERMRLQVDAGFGLRYSTLIGDLRGDLGYQLTRIESLTVEGEPADRRWRLHVSIGQAF